MAKKTAEYTNESISSLKGAKRVRQRPGVIFGSDGLDGCEHSVFEIISNSIDEARGGYGNKIIVTRFMDNSIEVQDFGRGIPVDFNSRENRYNWELLYCEMYAGGKYDSGNSAYEFSLGLNGLGLCSTQYASEYMDVEVKRDGCFYTLHFEKGENVGGLKKEEYSGRDTGTKTRWKPDLNVFTDIAIPLSYYQDILKRQAVANKGLSFILKNQIGANRFETFEYKYENGITDYVDEIVGDQALTSIKTWHTEKVGKDRPDKPEYTVVINAAVCFSNRVTLKEYHNSSWLEYGGAPEKAVRNAFTYQIDSYIKQTNKYQKNESKISFSDIEECLVLCVNSFSTKTSYENQTKKSVTNQFIYEAMNDFFRRELEIYFIENKSEADKIADQVLINKRSRERSERERLNLKKTLQTSNDITKRIQKFVDCRSRNVAERELFIVEGDSALGACQQARFPEFQALMPVRGKILNCLKSDLEKIFKSDIITDLIKILGCGVEAKRHTKDLATFDIENLKWNKIIICTDADVDGFQIRTLILTMLYRLTPTLINEGKVYIAETPLYEISCKDKIYFAYDEREKASILADLEGQKYTIQRSKGLGENQPEMMNFTTMNPSTRRLVKVMPDDAKRTEEMFDVLLGDNLQGRKDYIAENGYLYYDDADVS